MAGRREQHKKSRQTREGGGGNFEGTQRKKKTMAGHKHDIIAPGRFFFTTEGGRENGDKTEGHNTRNHSLSLGADRSNL